MPGIRYTGLAAKFNDVWFAWRFLGTIVLVLFLFSLWLIASGDEVPGQNRIKVALREGGASSHMDPLEKSVINRFDPVPIRELTACTAREIPWSEFVKHSCATEDLWLVIDGHVYDLWPWGTCKQCCGNGQWETRNMGARRQY